MDIYRRFLTLCRTIRRHGTSCIALHSCARQAKEMAHSPSVQKPPHPIRNRGQRPHQTCHSSGRALVIGEIGSTESQGLDCYMRREGSPTRYPPILRDQLFTLCGVLAPTDAFLDQFCSVYLNAVDAVDLLAVWGNSGESNVVAGHAGKAVLIQRFSLEPYTSTIRGRALSLAKPCLSFTLSWRLRFDVALIGAGAILPFAAFVKSRGRIGIHTGGPTQILFGILGRRWEETRENRVLRSQFKRVEQGGYW